MTLPEPRPSKTSKIAGMPCTETSYPCISVHWTKYPTAVNKKKLHTKTPSVPCLRMSTKITHELVTGVPELEVGR